MTGPAVTDRYDHSARLALVVIAGLWHLAVDLPGTVAGWPAYRVPAVAAVAWLAFTAVGLLAARRLLRGRPDRAPWPPLAVLLAADVAVFATTPPELVFHNANWGWGALGWFAIAVLWWQPTRAVVWALAVNAGVALVAVLAAGATAPVDLARYGMYVYGTVALQVLFVAAVRMLRSAAGQAAEAATQAAALHAARQAAEAARQDRHARYREVRRQVGGLLGELASGRADPADPVLQRRCAVAAAGLRRLIAEADDVPDPLLHELRACADLAGRAGVPVDLVAVGSLPQLPRQVRRQLTGPLLRPLATVRGSARITVTGGPDEVAVSVVATDGELAESAGADHPDVTYTWQREEDLVWVQTRWRVR